VTLSPASSRTPAGGELEYQQFVADVSVTSTSEAAPDVIVTADALTLDGATVVLIEFSCQCAKVDSSASAQLVFNLQEDGTDIGRIAQVQNASATGSDGAPVRAALRRTPAAGSHTYRVVAWATAAGTYLAQAGAGGAGVSVPGFLLVTRIS
jgi:hypothetical protein